MKYINNGVGQNIIKDSDINLSESFQNQNLAEILTKYKEELDTLKSNVKWLAKYGGVGGSGSGTDATIKLKYKVDIKYIDVSDIEKTESLSSKSSGTQILPKENSKAVVTITLQKCMPNTDYKVILNYGDQKHTFTINSLTLTGSQSIICTGNNSLNITVYATPDDMPATSVNIYTVAKTANLNIKLENNSIVSSGGIMLQNWVDTANLVGTLTNYLPEKFEGEFTRLTINGIETEFESSETIGMSGETITEFKISSEKIFNEFGIYEIILYYSYNGLEEVIKNTYIYKDNPVFLYCFGENNTVYSKEQESPKTSDFSIERVKCRIYPDKDDPTNQKYSGIYTIQYEDGEDSITGEIFQQEANKNFEISFPNKYKDFTEVDYKKITITFKINDIEFNYYIYVTKVPEIDFFFKNDYEKLFYNAVHNSTRDGDSDNFPFKNGQFEITKEFYAIPDLTTTTSLDSKIKTVFDNSNTGYINTNNTIADAVNPDVLISFGLKYYESNLDKPILTINIGSKVITLYSNKIKYGDNTYTRWCIPNDNTYHLIQLYYKPIYSINGHKCKNLKDYTTISNGTSAFIFCIDGIFETQPINIDNTELISFNKKNSTITYHQGKWDFNFISFASFNAKPRTWEDSITNDNNFTADSVLRYVFDFDPIIPANYYQGYCKAFDITVSYNNFDKGIYGTLFSKNFGVNYYKDNCKFIPSDIVTLGKLTNLPIYVIEPESFDGEINNFLQNTISNNFSEDNDNMVVNCNFKKCKIEGTDLIEYNIFNDSKYNFKIEYQGSSTLKYGVKNFEIYANPFRDENEDDQIILWSPNSNFKPEQSFTLKADVVDSSHSNNVIIGKFVNTYMEESAFSSSTSEKNKTCLEGFPILLFMKDVNSSDESSNSIFLGIYSFNLGRKSVYNLGYKHVDLSSQKSISSSNSEAQAYLITDINKITYPNKYRVAEVQGNSPVLFDYSQYDYALLKNKMLGDFFNYDGSENNSFSKDIQKPFKGLAKLIYKYYIKEIPDYEFPNDDTLIGYSSCELFNVLQLNFNYNKKIPVQNNFYYYNESAIEQVPNEGFVLSNLDVESIKPYLTKGADNVSVINNPLYQFHLVCDQNGNSNSNTYYYVEKLDPAYLTQFGETDDYFDYDALLRYYIVCMLFAMVDSVQKNLTIRCQNYDNSTANEWIVGFYDMDTSFGLNNSGGEVDFKTFSDYIDNDGTIISDYYSEDSENQEGSNFDIPSSFLFLIAKYLNILLPDENNDVDKMFDPRTYSDSGKNDILKTPFNYWQTLRSDKLKDLDEFFTTYVDNHFAETHPLLWNLNYMYKYFSETKTQGDDTEISKFNGTRKFSRKSWLKQRLEIIDVLFGIRNNHPIGKSNNNYICKQKIGQEVSEQQTYTNFITNVPISQSMFPNFAKGISTANINTMVTTYPKAPVVLQTSVDTYRLYLANNKGEINNIKGNITSNTDCGFYGTKSLKYIDECGQFLVNSNTNTIENDLIKDINITKSLQTGVPVKLDVNKLQSLENINVSNYKCNTFIIENKSNQERKLNKISFNKVDGPLTISNLTINELELTNLIGSELKLENVTIGKLTINNCNFENYILSGKIPNFSINDPSTKMFNLIAGTDIEVEINIGNTLEQLMLQGKIAKFNNNIDANNCTTISINGISSANPILYLQKFTGYDGELKINCTSDVKSLTLCCNSNQKVKKYSIEASGVGDINLLQKAFSDNYVLEDIIVNKTSLIKSEPKIHIKGSHVFSYCKSLNVDSIIPNELEKMQIENPDCQLMYTGTQVYINDVIKFFTNINSVNNLNLYRTFADCSNIEEQCTQNPDGTVSINESLEDFKSALSKFKGANNIMFCETFACTKFNYLNSDLVKLFAYTDSGTIILNDPCSACSVNFYVTSDFLNGTNVECIKLGNRISHAGKIYPETLTRIINISSIDIDKLLTGISVIEGIHLYTDENLKINCSDGFPDTLKSIKQFNVINSEYWNFSGLENLFSNVEGCDVYFDMFFSQKEKLNNENPINIYDLFFNNRDINLKLTEITKSNELAKRGQKRINYCPSFQKKCTQGQFREIMNYLKESQENQLKGEPTNCDLYNQIPGLFKFCTITNVTSFEELIEYDNGTTYFDKIIFEDNSINFIDLDSTFYGCNLKSESESDIYFDITQMWTMPTSVYNMHSTFRETNQKKITSIPKLTNVNNLDYGFYNCKWYYDYDSYKPLLSSPAGDVKFAPGWNWYNDFSILPSKFFNICNKLNENSCTILECFASESSTSNNLQGQLNVDLGIDLNKISVTSLGHLFQNALIHPIKSGENYYIYPKEYTDKFNSYKNMYDHTILPLNKNAVGKLYLFQDSTIELNLTTRLPHLPKLENEQWYNEVINTNAVIIYINHDNKFNNSTTYMTKSDYKHLIPASLLLALSNVDFVNIIPGWAGPFVIQEGEDYNYNETWTDTFKVETTNSGIQDKLFKQ